MILVAAQAPDHADLAVEDVDRALAGQSRELLAGPALDRPAHEGLHPAEAPGHLVELVPGRGQLVLQERQSTDPLG